MAYNPPIGYDTILSLNPYESSISVDSLIDFHEVALIKFNPQEKFFRTSTCFIPPNKLFCFGNTEGAFYTGKTVLIEGEKAIIMRPGRACINSGLIYMSGCIYAFGGNNSINLTLCEKFSILRNKWSKLASLETYIAHCVCVEFCGKVLYTGNSNLVYLYDIYLNSHTIVLKDAQLNKLLCHWDERAYIIESTGKIYESCKRNPFKWSQVNSLPPTKFINYNYTGISVFFADSWYFRFRSGEIYIFDFEEKKLAKRYLDQ